MSRIYICLECPNFGYSSLTCRTQELLQLGLIKLVHSDKVIKSVSLSFLLSIIAAGAVESGYLILPNCRQILGVLRDVKVRIHKKCFD